MRANLPSVFAAGAVALLLSTAPAFAEVLNFSADLNGAAEVPPNDSPGTGTVIADYDTETKLFKWNISYQGLTGPATAAHFHGPANPDENAPPVIPVDLEPEAAGADAATSAEAEPATPTDAEPATPEDAEVPTDIEPEPMTEAEQEGPAEGDQDASTETPAEPAAEAETDADADATTPAEIMPGEPADPEAANQLSGEATLTEEQAADLLAGQWYFNIHTAMYPDGELRGQLPPEED